MAADQRADGLRKVRRAAQPRVSWPVRRLPPPPLGVPFCARCSISRLHWTPVQAMEGMVEGLDRSTMRPLQKESYLCMAKCCDRCGRWAAGHQLVHAECCSKARK